MKWYTEKSTISYSPAAYPSIYEQNYNLLKNIYEKNEIKLKHYYAAIQLKRFVLDIHSFTNIREMHSLLDDLEKET